MKDFDEITQKNKIARRDVYSMANENRPVDPKGKKEDPEIKTTALGGMVELFKANIGDTIAYFIMTIGLIVCFFEPFVGGIPVGFVMGLYFSKRVFFYTLQFRDFLIMEGIFRGFIIIASLVALAISAPGLALGIFLGAITRPIFGTAIHDKDPQDP